jgi:hypothetical protein
MSDYDGDAEDSEIPLLYRIILRFPRLSIDGFSDRFQGLFWALILPIFVVSGTMATLLLMVCLPFPLNFISVVTLTSMILMFMLRIFVERELNMRRAIVEEGRFRWNVETAMQEYAQLLQKRKRDKEDEQPP